MSKLRKSSEAFRQNVYINEESLDSKKLKSKLNYNLTNDFEWSDNKHLTKNMKL